MTAPALVLLAHGSCQPRVAETLHSLRKQMQTSRPHHTIQLAFLDHCSPTPQQVVSALAGRGVREIVLVPLDLTHAVDVEPKVHDVVERLRAQHTSVSFGLAQPVGPACDLLNVVDERLRAALRTGCTTELDGLVLSLPCGGDVRGNALISRRARQWSTHHKLPVVVAVCDGTGPHMTQAIHSLRAQGRRHIAVGSLFVAPDEAFATQAEAAVGYGAEAVGGPIGPDERLIELIMGRYAFAAMELLDADLLNAIASGDAPAQQPSLQLVGAQ